MGAGWYYLFYSRAVEKLDGLESARTNQQRGRLRRVGGLVIMLLGACLYIGFFGVSWDPPTRAFATVWLSVFILLAAAVILAMTDLILTRKLRRQIREASAAHNPTKE